ncbi:ParA family protein [Streptomyces sp. NPDC002787]
MTTNVRQTTLQAAAGDGEPGSASSVPAARRQPEVRQKRIVVGGLKGGVGKSTLAMFLALYYYLVHGLKVLVVDADPSSQTCFDWHETAKKKGGLPFDLEVWSNPQVGRLIETRATEYDIVIVDCGGDNDAIFKAAVAVADYVLVVASPRKAEMRRIHATLVAAVQGAKDAARKGIPVRVLFTRVKNARVAHNKAMRDKLMEAGLPLMTAEVPDLVEYEDAVTEIPTEVGHYKDVAEEMGLVA